MDDFEDGALATADELPAGVEFTETPFAGLPSDDDDGSQPQADEETQQTAEPVKEEAYQLPDSQSKVFPDQEIERYAAARFPKLLASFKNPETREGVREILQAHLNSDVYIQQLRKEREEAEKEEDEQEETEDAQAAPEARNLTQEQLSQEITSFVDRVTDPEVAKAFWTQINEATAKALGPKGDGKDGDGGVAFTKAVSAGMVNLMRDAIPALLGGQNGLLEQFLDGYMGTRYQGLQESHVDSMQRNAWNSVKTSDPAYANLPDYQTPEWIAAHEKAAQMVPGIEDAIFTDAKGHPLPRIEQFSQKAKIAAKLIAGTLTQKDVQRTEAAVEKGKQLAEESANRKRNANLGAGQSRGRIAQGQQPQGIDAARKAAIQRMNRDNDPFAALRPAT